MTIARTCLKHKKKFTRSLIQLKMRDVAFLAGTVLICSSALQNLTNPVLITQCFCWHQLSLQPCAARRKQHTYPGSSCTKNKWKQSHCYCLSQDSLCHRLIEVAVLSFTNVSVVLVFLFCAHLSSLSQILRFIGREFSIVSKANSCSQTLLSSHIETVVRFVL